METKELLPIREIARRAGVHPMTVRRWIYRGWLAGVKLGGVLRVKEDDFQRFCSPPEPSPGERKSE
jgi:excisionase family DNA binding protein